MPKKELPSGRVLSSLKSRADSGIRIVVEEIKVLFFGIGLSTGPPTSRTP